MRNEPIINRNGWIFVGTVLQILATYLSLHSFYFVSSLGVLGAVFGTTNFEDNFAHLVIVLYCFFAFFVNVKYEPISTFIRFLQSFPCGCFRTMNLDCASFSKFICKSFCGIVFGIIALVILVFFYASIYSHCDQSLALGEERYMDAADEEFYIESLWKSVYLFNLNNQQKKPFRTTHRAQHAKTVGCVNAEIHINEDIEEGFDLGLFANKGKQYRSWIRYSTSDQNIIPDSNIGARGMAIKIVDVDGERTDVSKDSTEQDILLLSSDTFFMADSSLYISFLESFPDNMGGWILSNFRKINTYRTLLSIYNIFSTGGKMTNPLDWTWYSSTPYRLGDKKAIKYVAKPCVKLGDIPTNDKDPDFLRTNLQNSLNQAEGCFDLYVQKQEDSCKQPVEDPIVSWGNKGLVLVAKIIIPVQNILTEGAFEFCENLGFNPWNGLQAHKPMGEVNLGRKLYMNATEQRRRYNNVTDYTPVTGEEKFDNSLPLDANSFYNRTTIASGIVDTYQFSPYYDPVYPFLDKMKLPGKITHLIDDNTKFTSYKMARIVEAGLGGVNNVLQELLADNSFDKMKEPQDFVHMFSAPSMKAKLPWVTYNGQWMEDYIWANQWIRGLNPISIHKVSEIPKNLAIKMDGKLVNGAIIGEENLQQLFDSGRVFYADYLVIDSIKAHKDFYEPHLQCVKYGSQILFYLHQDNDLTTLTPLVIQLNVTDPEHTTFYPPRAHKHVADYEKNEEKYKLIWLFAKMHASSSDAQYHEMITHLGTTHLMLEPIIVGSFRQFKEDHPVFRVLKPHMRQTVSINELGRLTLLNPTGYFEKLTSLGMKGTMLLIEKVASKYYNYTEFAFPNLMKSRGFTKIPQSEIGGKKDDLPGYLYRDYGFWIYEALEEYVTTILDKFYHSDEDVQNDVDIQRWAKEISNPEFGNVRGFPETIESKDMLVLVCTHFIFTAVGQHSAVNFGQFDFYGFIPNKPLSLTSPMPQDPVSDKNFNMAYIMDALPHLQKTKDQMTITFILSMTPTNVMSTSPEVGEFVGQKLADWLFAEPEWRPYFTEEFIALTQALEKTEKMMKTNNMNHGYRYPYLYYNEMAMSIAI
eukprot:TRINITY_DN10552_c0_g1_i1.p1 TRINITY_DN10552_c0_g1~~TRINITY_DN10552_c0_g1_i1.p1  ORF type:complete len:1088 (-),score=233.73 TRINITY_DN10552_c0_g1_i1:32-3295(-)